MGEVENEICQSCTAVNFIRVMKTGSNFCRLEVLRGVLKGEPTISDAIDLDINVLGIPVGCPYGYKSVANVPIKR